MPTTKLLDNNTGNIGLGKDFPIDGREKKNHKAMILSFINFLPNQAF